MEISWKVPATPGMSLAETVRPDRGDLCSRHALPVRHIRAGPGTRRTACRRRAVPVEPQVFALLALLVENRERLVSRDEIIEKVWDGRIVSDAAVSSRIKSARQALGDDGKAQRYIRTIHGQGLRFVRRRPGRAWRFDCQDRVASTRRRRERTRDRPMPDHAAVDRRAAVSPDRRRRTLRRHCRRPAPRTDHRAVAPALAVRHRARLVVPPARPGCRHGRDRPPARRALLPVRHGRGRRPRTSSSPSSSSTRATAASSGPIASPARSTTCTRSARTSARGS